MLYNKIICLSLVLFGICYGCGLKEGVIQNEAKSYIYFTGDTQNAVAYIDDLDPINLNSSSNDVHFEISSGKHNIIVKKSGKEVVNRTLLLGSGITREIRIP